MTESEFNEKVGVFHFEFSKLAGRLTSFVSGCFIESKQVIKITGNKVTSISKSTWLDTELQYFVLDRMGVSRIMEIIDNMNEGSEYDNKELKSLIKKIEKLNRFRNDLAHGFLLPGSDENKEFTGFQYIKRRGKKSRKVFLDNYVPDEIEIRTNQIKEYEYAFMKGFDLHSKNIRERLGKRPE